MIQEDEVLQLSSAPCTFINMYLLSFNRLQKIHGSTLKYFDKVYNSQTIKDTLPPPQRKMKIKERKRQN